MKRLLALSVTAFAGIAAAPAVAQDSASESANERVMMVTIAAGEECPVSEDPDTIVVCDEIDPNEQYRIPSQLRRSEAPENRSWTERSRSFQDVARMGPGSCTAVGGGSELGCTAREIEEAVAERENAPERRFSLQIEEARRERLETIDGEAARTQARVEELERAYMERLEAERDAPLPGEEEEALPELQVVDPDAIPQRAPESGN